MPHGDAGFGDYLNSKAIECAGFSHHRCPREALIPHSGVHMGTSTL
jgi:hypothetical protein